MRSMRERVSEAEWEDGAQKAGSGYALLEWPPLLRALDRLSRIATE